jgi:hypothetical protein
VDHYVAIAWPGVLALGSPLIVDLGYGAVPWTALEMFDRWRAINPRLRLLGVEIDPDRVAAALPYEQPGVIAFRLGGFNLADLLGADQARIVRAFNVLRQYDEAAVEPALAQIAAGIEPGGLLIEGTSNPSGRVAVFDVYQKAAGGDLIHRELIFSTNFRAPLDVTDFQAVLPKRLIHHAQDEVPAAFFDAWKRSLLLARAAGHLRPARQWTAAAVILRERFDYAIDPRARLIRRGYLPLRDDLCG